MTGTFSSPNQSQKRPVHRWTFALLSILALFAPSALALEPVTKNSLDIKPNPTATVSKACDMEDKSQFDALIYATCYSERNKAVVVLVSGNAGEVSGQRIAEHITTEFEKLHIPSVGFLSRPEWDKVAVAYLLNGDYYGPYSGQTWKEGKKILTMHSAQAWYQTRPRN